MKAHLEDLKGDYSKDVSFKEIDISSDLASARKYRVQTVPTVIIVNNSSGAVLSSIQGLQNKEIYQMQINNSVNAI